MPARRGPSVTDRLFRDHPQVLDLLSAGAIRWTFAAHYGLARLVAQQVVERTVRVYGNEHPHTATAYVRSDIGALPRRRRAVT